MCRKQQSGHRFAGEPVVQPVTPTDPEVDHSTNRYKPGVNGAKGKMSETNLENLEVPQPETVTVLGDTPETPEEKQVTMSQTALDNLIKSRQSAALKKTAALEAENQRLKEIAAGQGANATELERIRGELSASKLERDAIAAEAARNKKESFIAAQVQKLGFVCDPTTLTRLTQDEITYDEATKQFVTADGSSADDYFKRFAESRPYLIKSTVVFGTGSSGSTGSTPPPQVPLEFYFGPKSNSAAVNKLAIQRPDEYKRLRRAAIAKGLIS